MKREIQGRRLYRLLYPRQVILVSCFDRSSGKPNVLPVAWATPLSADPFLVGILLTKNRYSYGLIEKSGEFAINIPTMELLEKIKKCGSTSGSSINKFKEFGLTQVHASKIHTPLVKECIAHLECKLVKMVETGDHILFIGEVVAVSAEEGIFENEAMNLEKAKLVYQIGGDNYTTF
ncbi:MAG: flavin reductase family protein [Candidatus Hadarchaeales archaeon]